MKLAGHTMGTPEYSLKDAIKLFASFGLDGAEIIVQTDGYGCALSLNASEHEVLQVRKMVEDSGLTVSGLTPYLNLFNSLDNHVRTKECDDLKRVIDLAVLLDSHNIRVYGGRLLDGETDIGERKLQALITSMRTCGSYAATMGVQLNLENHFGTMTTTAAETAKVVQLIDSPGVGILYDQANIAFFPAEDYETAIELQKRWISYVHCKDLVYREGPHQRPKFAQVSHVDEKERTVYSRIPGEGILDWPAILRKLRDVGYDGWISLEYERRWQKLDLPDATLGMRKAAAFVQRIMGEMYE